MRSQSSTPLSVFVWLGSTALVAGLFIGCPTGRSPDPSDQRLIADDPAELFQAHAIVDEETRIEWRFDDPATRGEWRIESPRLVRPVVNGLALERQSDREVIALVREVDFDASEIDGFEIELAGMSRGEIVVEWQIAGQATGGKVGISLGEPIDRPFLVYRLRMLGNDDWQGRIRQLRLTVEPPRQEVATLRAARGVAQTVDAASLEQLAGQPRKVAIGNDLRAAWLAVPEVPIERQITTAPGSELRFAYGTTAPLPMPVRFEVSTPSGPGEKEPLFEGVIEPGSTSWQEARVALPVITRPWELDFVTHAEGFDPRIGLPAWAHPRVHNTAGGVFAVDKGPLNVVLISLDTLRADHLSLYGYPKGTSPRIDAWARQHGAVFEKTVASAPWTLPSHVSLFTGLDAHRHGVNYSQPAPSSLVLLAEVLRDAGYTTRGITGGGYVHPQWGFSQGFDAYSYFGEQMGFSDELQSNMHKAVEFLHSRPEPFFLFFHTYEIHNPYIPREPYFELNMKPDQRGLFLRIDHPERLREEGFIDARSFSLMKRGEVIEENYLPGPDETLLDNLYDSGIFFTDLQIGRLLDTLDQLNLSERTLVVLTSDHGEMLGEHGLASHLSLYEQNLLIPLIIADPRGRGAGQRVTKQVRQIDVMPTILDLLGLAAPSGIDGSSLLPEMLGQGNDPRPAWSYAAASNYGVSLRLRNQLKYISKNHVWPSPAMVQEELFDLRSDPGEAANLASGDPRLDEVRRQVATKLHATASGLRLSFAHDGPGVLRGDLRGGRVVGTTTIKTAVGSCQCMTTEDGAVARFELQAGERLTVWFENATSGTLQVNVELTGVAGDARVLQHRVEVESIENTYHMAWQDGAWTTFDAPPTQISSGLTLTWHGLQQSASDAQAIDPELRRQLEALGYTNP